MAYLHRNDAWHAHLKTVEMLRHARTVGSAASLLASTFYHVCNSGWRKLENPLSGLALVNLLLSSTYTLEISSG